MPAAKSLQSAGSFSPLHVGTIVVVVAVTVRVVTVMVVSVAVVAVAVVAVVVVVQALHSTGHVASNVEGVGLGSSFASSHSSALYLPHPGGSAAPLHSTVVVVTVVAEVVSGHASHKAGHAAVTSLPTNRSLQKRLPKRLHCDGSATPSQVPSASAAVVGTVVFVVVVFVIVAVVAVVVGGGGDVTNSHVLHSAGQVAASGNGAKDAGSPQNDSSVGSQISGSTAPLHVGIVVVVVVLAAPHVCGQSIATAGSWHACHVTFSADRYLLFSHVTLYWLEMMAFWSTL